MGPGGGRAYLALADGRGGAYLALAEGGAVVDLVAAGALAQGLAATVHTGLLQEDRVSVVGTPPRDTEEGQVTGTRLTRISCPRPTDSEQEAEGWITYRPTSLQTAGISFPPSMQKANWEGQTLSARPWKAPGWAPTNSLGAPGPAPQASLAHQLGSVKWAFCVLSPQSVTLFLLKWGGAVGVGARG